MPDDFTAGPPPASPAAALPSPLHDRLATVDLHKSGREHPDWTRVRRSVLFLGLVVLFFQLAHLLLYGNLFRLESSWLAMVLVAGVLVVVVDVCFTALAPRLPRASASAGRTWIGTTATIDGKEVPADDISLTIDQDAFALSLGDCEGRGFVLVKATTWGLRLRVLHRLCVSRSNSVLDDPVSPTTVIHSTYRECARSSTCPVKIDNNFRIVMADNYHLP